MNGAALALHGITQRFGAQTVLDGVELAVAAGERHALIGRTARASRRSST